MVGRLLDRLSRAARRAEEAGLAGILVTPSADLIYLAGYDPPLLERLTCLVVRPGRDPVLLVPALERPRAVESPVGQEVDIAEWRDGEDPYAAVSRLLEPSGRFGASDRMWAAHLLGLQQALPDAAFVTAFGVRIEDIVAVTEDGAVRLNRASRNLETVS